MAEAATRLAVKTEEKPTEKPAEKQGKESRVPAMTPFRPFGSLRREIDRMFDDFPWRLPSRRSLFDIDPLWRGVEPFWRGVEPFWRGFGVEPFSRGEIGWGKAPAVDVAETDKSYEIAAELPGMDEKDVEVNFSNGTLTIKGEKNEEKEEKKKDYYLSERHYGSFQRSFAVPDDVDENKIEAAFKNGVLTVSLPKTPEAQKKEKQIAIKTE
jgi:HSP20 family protein